MLSDSEVIIDASTLVQKEEYFLSYLYTVIVMDWTPGLLNWS